MSCEVLRFAAPGFADSLSALRYTMLTPSDETLAWDTACRPIPLSKDGAFVCETLQKDWYSNSEMKSTCREPRFHTPKAYFTLRSSISPARRVDFTEKDLMLCIRSFSGGGRWIRTTEGSASRFTVCPLWPLGNSPIFTFARLLRVELVDGLEPPTC